MFTSSRRSEERRGRERRTSPESIFGSFAALLGPRLRRQSAFQFRVGLEAIAEGSGAVMVITIPAGTNEPVEVQTYPAGVAIGLLDSARTTA